MKKLFRISALAALALGATTLIAQAQSTKHFGIVGGVNFSSFNGSDADGGSFDVFGDTYTVNTGSLTGFVGGIYAAIPVGTSVVFEPEVLYTSKGARYDTEYDVVDVGTFSDQLTYRLDYIEIPLLLRYNFQPAGGFYALAGPQVSFNVGCSADISGDLGTVLKDNGVSTDGGCAVFNILAETPSDIWIETQANTTIGGIVGVGFQKDRFGLEGRYDFDFGAAVDGWNAKNAAWEILARIMIK